MKRFILAKHWHFFIASFPIPIILFILGWYTPFTIFNGAPKFILIPMAIVIAQMTIYLWLWNIAKYFINVLPNHLKNKYTFFKWVIIIPVVLILLILLHFIIGASVVGFGKLSYVNEMLKSMYLILPLWIVLLLSKLFCFYYVSRVLQSLHTIRTIDTKIIFRNSEFLLMLLFPIGIWFLQPRINILALEIRDN